MTRENYTFYSSAGLCSSPAGVGMQLHSGAGIHTCASKRGICTDSVAPKQRLRGLTATGHITVVPLEPQSFTPWSSSYSSRVE